jgi:hypothetical protein
MHPNYSAVGDEPVNASKSNYIIKRDIASGRETTVFNYRITDKYQILQYTEGLKFLDYFLQEGYIKIEDALYLDGGATLAINCLVNEVAQVRGSNDDISPRLLYTLAHDNTPRGLSFTAHRAICRNTLMQAQVESMKNVGKWFGIDSNPVERLAKAKELIDFVKTTFHDEQIPMLRELDELNLEFTQVKNLLKDVFNINRNVQLPDSLAALDDDKFTMNVKRAVTTLDYYANGTGMSDYAKDEHTGYRVLNAATEMTQFLGKDGNTEPNSTFRNNYYGIGKTIRNNTLTYLSELLVR